MKLKKSYLAMLMASIMATGVSAATVQAEGISVGGDIGVYSQYMWRGMQQTAGSSVQGDLGADIGGGLSANVWFAAPIGNNAVGGNVTEFDWTVDYSGEMSDLSYSLGYIFYSYLNNATGNTGEVYAGLGYGPVAVTYYYATNSNVGGWKKNAYLDLALSHNVGGFDLGANMGFYFGKDSTATPADHINEFGNRSNGLGHVDLSISKDVSLADGVTMTPSIMISIPTSKDRTTLLRTKNANQFVAGVNFSY